VLACSPCRTLRLQLSDVSGDLGFSSGENRAACHNIRLDIRVIARESREHYGRALSCTPLLLRDCASCAEIVSSRGLRWTTTSTRRQPASGTSRRAGCSTAPEAIGGASRGTSPLVSSRGPAQFRRSVEQLIRESAAPPGWRTAPRRGGNHAAGECGVSLTCASTNKRGRVAIATVRRSSSLPTARRTS